MQFEGADPGATTYSVGELGRIIGRALEQALPDEVWVRGEISSMSRSKRGHVYFDLVEDMGRGRKAQLPVTLFAQEWQYIQNQLVDVPDFRLEEGLEVRIRGRVTFYAPFGKLQLTMTGVDPVFTLGALAANRDRLLRQLEREGVLGLNRQVAIPPVPLVVGLVTSHGSAAYTDFVTELSTPGFAFRVVTIDTRVQGPQSAPMVVRAIRTLAFRGVDVIALVRGGGSATDLAAFDDERVARAIAACDTAVLTGIGHEVDTSVADHCAHLRCKTPTAVAAELVQRVRAYRDRVEAAWGGISSVAAARVATADERIERLATGATRAATGLLRHHGARLDTAAARVSGPHLLAVLDRQQHRLSERAERLALTAPRHLTAAERALAAAADRARLLDPARTLERGYTITRGPDGRAVRDPSTLAEGDEVLTAFATGSVRSRVTGIDTSTEEP